MMNNPLLAMLSGQLPIPPGPSTEGMMGPMPPHMMMSTQGAPTMDQIVNGLSAPPVSQAAPALMTPAPASPVDPAAPQGDVMSSPPPMDVPSGEQGPPMPDQPGLAGLTIDQIIQMMAMLGIQVPDSMADSVQQGTTLPVGGLGTDAGYPMT